MQTARNPCHQSVKTPFMFVTFSDTNMTKQTNPNLGGGPETVQFKDIGLEALSNVKCL